MAREDRSTMTTQQLAISFLLILLAVVMLTSTALGIFYCCYIHPKMLKEQQRFNEFKQAYLRQWR